MKARVNGVERDLPDGMSVAGLLRELGAAQSGLAVAVNERVVGKALHEDTRLAEGDAVEIIRAVAGG